MNKHIYGFAFGKGSCADILWRLKEIDCCYQVFGETSVKSYMNFLIHDQPAYIIGLGLYSGVDQGKIRIEQKCSNKFRNEYREETSLTEIEINYFLQPLRNSKYASGIGNSYCNLISYKIMKLIQSGELKAQYTFLHIPKLMKQWEAQKEIDHMLLQFKIVS